MSYEYTPKPRLHQYPIGATIRLVGVDRKLTITAILEDGYIELAPGVTASAGHLVEVDK